MDGLIFRKNHVVSCDIKLNGISREECEQETNDGLGYVQAAK